MLRRLAGPLFLLAVILFVVAKLHGIHLDNTPAKGNTTAVQVTSASETAFFRAVLKDLGAPANPANVGSLIAWFSHEFPSWPPRAVNNPMASTLKAPGATVYNKYGVRNYPSATVGAEKTAETLNNGYYPGIVAALRAGKGLCGGSHAHEFLTWSRSIPGSGYSSIC